MKVLLADDHAVVRTGMRRLLESHESVYEILEADSGIKALEIINKSKPDLVILDISMPGLSGIDVLIKTKEQNNTDAKFLILSMYPEREYALRALKAGASGYITKESAADELLLAIDSVSAGKRYVSKNLQEILFDFNSELSPHEKLSEREFKVFILLSQGKRNQEIADSLFISAKTVSTYKSRIFEKMKMTTVQELTKYAVQNNLIE